MQCYGHLNKQFCVLFHLATRMPSQGYCSIPGLQDCRRHLEKLWTLSQSLQNRQRILYKSIKKSFWPFTWIEETRN